MKKNESVQKIMNTQLVSLTGVSSFTEIKEVFTKYPFHHIPVLEGEKLIGIITSNDMLKSKFSEKIFGDERNADAVMNHTIKAKDIMTKNIITLSPEATVREATEILKDKPFNALPIVDENKMILGLITTKDLVKFLFGKY